MPAVQHVGCRSAVAFAFLVQLDRETEPGCEAMVAVAQHHHAVPAMNPALRERDRGHDPPRECGHRDFAMNRIVRRRADRTAGASQRSRIRFAADTQMPQGKNRNC